MESPHRPPRKPALSGRALGLILIFLTALIWVAASFISQLLVNTQEGQPSYNVTPFLLTYLSTSIFTIFLPLVQLKNLVQQTWLLRRSFKYKPLQEADNGNDADDEQLLVASSLQQHQQQSQQHETAAPGSLEADLDFAEAAAAAEQASAAARASAVAHKESFIAAAQCFLLWFTAQYLFNASLALTSVTSNTILSSTSSLFTFALSMIVLKEPYSFAKLLSIAACIGGTLLVTLSDSSSGRSSNTNVGSTGAIFNHTVNLTLSGNTITVTNSTAAINSTAGAALGAVTSGPSHSVVGDMLCLVSACFYASYTIVLRKSLPDDDEANVALFFGYIGLLCSVVFAPVVAVLAGMGSMHLKTIPPKAYLIILVEGILNYCLSDYLWAHAVLLLGPTIATLGLSVQIPVAAVVEVIIGVPKWLSNSKSIAMMVSGTALIMAGFFAGNLAGGGQVYGSHHRGDEDITGQQQRRRSSGGFHFTADDILPDSSSSRTDGLLSMPVSTHATVGGRLPVHHGSSSNGHVPYLQQQQQRQQQQPLQDQRDFQVPPQHEVLLQSTHQSAHQPANVELSSLPSSTRSSVGRSSGSSPFSYDKAGVLHSLQADSRSNQQQQAQQQQQQQQDPGGGSSSSRCASPARSAAGGSPGSAIDLELQHNGSPVRLKQPNKGSRLQKAS